MEELVKRLRNCVDSLCGECKYQQLQKPGNFVPCMNAMITEAADAIEELNKLADAIPHVCECCIGCEMEKKNRGCNHGFVLSPKRAKEYLIKPRWIPVEERRAEIPCICCDANGNMPFIPQGIVTIEDDQGVWQIDAHLADLNLYQNRLKPVLGYQNRITHWMPLPPAPKEE